MTETTMDGGEVALRIVVERAPAGVRFAVQRGRDALIPPTREDGATIVFDLRARVAAGPDGAPTLRGEVTQGPPASRFVYVTSGLRAGQPGSPWERRAKVPLTAITPAQLAEASRGGVLEARIEGTAKDGGPACASVPLLGGGWTRVDR